MRFSDLQETANASVSPVRSSPWESTAPPPSPSRTLANAWVSVRKKIYIYSVGVNQKARSMERDEPPPPFVPPPGLNRSAMWPLEAGSRGQQMGC